MTLHWELAAVVASASTQSEEPFFEDRIALVPQLKGKTD
jgi:hypothetical protein